jgi:hypothetical protein
VPYFNVAPAKETLSVPVGGSITLDLYAFSDAPTDDWIVAVGDFSAQIGSPASAVTPTLDRQTANNGTTLHLTVTANRPLTSDHPALLLLTSREASTSRLLAPTIHRWPIAVTTR